MLRKNRFFIFILCAGFVLPLIFLFIARDTELKTILWIYAYVALFNALLAFIISRIFKAHRKNEEALRQSEERTRLIIETAYDAFVGMDSKGIITGWNPQAEKTFGWSREEAIGRTLAQTIIPPALREAHERGLKHFLKTGEGPVLNKRIEITAWHRKGHEFPVELTISPLKMGEIYVFNAFIHDISERKKIDQMKNEFISTVSHELRTPLTSIRGSLGLIAGGMSGEIPLQAKPLLEIAINNCERLVRLINDILDIEKIESGRMEFRLSPLLLCPLLEQALEANRAYGEEYKVNFVLENNEAPVTVHVDNDKLMQVMNNLLSNAAKFSPPGSTVRVRVSKKDSWVRVSVIDQGLGIPKEFQNRIFGKFAQADASDSRKKGGTGLGLSISKAILEHMNGKIGFESHLNKGSTFYFELPEWHELAPKLSPPSMMKPRLLICEDDHDVARLLSLMLEQSGYSSDIAYSAEQALRLLKEQNYDAMTLDIMLPDQNGASLIHQLRNISSTKDMPIIVISVKAEATRREFQGNGVNVIDWINKPIEPHRLQEAIQKIARIKKGSLSSILHVEDDVDTTRWVATLLQDVARLVPAYTFQEAKDKIEKEIFDLILLDILLPDGDGAELLPLIKLRYGNSIPVIILSSKESSAEIRKRVAAVLMKSRTSNDELLRTIQSVLPKLPVPPPLISTRHADKPHLLICEDDFDTAQLLSLMLIQQNYNADIAYSGEQALQLLEKNPYEGMTLDIFLPDFHGMSLLKKIRENPKTRNLPVVVVSVTAQNARRELEGSALQVVDWLDKPINTARLLQVVQEIVKKKKGSRPCILHVEDNADILKIVSMTLGKIAEIIPAYNLQQAREEIGQKKLDLVLLDINLPDGSGLELLPLLSDRPRDPIPVVIFSSQELEEDMKQKVTATLIKKDTSQKALLEMIQSVLKKNKS